MLLDNNGRILKPIQTPPRGKKEVEFYQTVFGCEFNESIAKLRQFVPTFYGIEHVALPKLSQGDILPSIYTLHTKQDVLTKLFI